MTSWLRQVANALLGVALVAGLASTASAQGTTTGAIGGTVTDSAGKGIEARVRIFDPSTGFTRLVATRPDGSYILTGLETGRYRVTASAIGYRAETRENIRVQLSQTARVDFVLSRQAVELAELVVETPPSASAFSPTRTGVQTAVSDTIIRRLPTQNRQLQDFVRLSPQVTVNPVDSSLSVAGQNNRYNAIQVDGTTQNDRFGLGSTGELGGQAGGRGISLEAVKEYQVVISPYNVTQGGFTGALVNAVTKNGTNDVRATAFYTFRNSDLGSNDPFIANSNFKIQQFGGSIGGPIIRNKLHFFVAGELMRSRRPPSGPYIGQPANASVQLRVDQALIDRFNAALARYGIEGGSGGPVDIENPITNLVGRLDYTINENHRLVVREIFNDSKADDFSRSASNFYLTSNRFRRSERANSITAQLFSTFRNGSSNELQVGWVRQRFRRALSVIAPQIHVTAVPSPTIPGSTVDLFAGADSNSHGNDLAQDFLELRNDYSFTLGGLTDHLFTVGTRSDIYKVVNGFLQNTFGSWGFSSLDNLENGIANTYAVGIPRSGDGRARFTAANLAFYVQDQWSVTRDLHLTLGLRAEAPVFFDKPTLRPEIERDFGRRTNEVPSNWTFNPRVGFNWDVGGQQKTQVRGGVGLFAGIPPYVWLSNLFTNSGADGVAQLSCTPANRNPAPRFDQNAVKNPPQACGNGAGLATGVIGQVNTIDPNYKQTQIVRASAGIDQRLPYNLVGTLEGYYTYSLKSPFMVNLALADPVGRDPNGRVMYGTLASNGVPTTAIRQPNIYSGGVYDLRNTKGDYTYGITGQLRRSFGTSFEASVAYSYQRSYSVVDFTSSVAASNFRNGRVTAGNQFDTRVDPSAFDRPHRVVASATYTAPWKNFPTDISLFYQGQSGNPFTYTYTGSGGRGDMNADGVSTNDPIFIPVTANPASFQQFTTGSGSQVQTVTPQQQADAFNAFVDAMPCLRSQRGQIMRRNTCRNPWFNQLDLSIRQSLPKLGGHRLTLQADIFNFLNFLDKDWGQFRAAGNTGFPQVSLLSVQSMLPDGTPLVRFQPGLVNYDQRFPKQLRIANYWQAQFTLRYAY